MKTVNIILYEGVAELDFCGPYEALASCRRLKDGKWSDKPAFLVETVAEHRATLSCASGLTVLPDKSLRQARESDIILVPGGPGARREILAPHLLEYLHTARATAELVASVGTGAFILGRAQLLQGRRATTHSTQLHAFANLFAHTSVVQGPRVVSDGLDLMSSGGMTAGLDLALTMIMRYEGDETARLAAKRLEWNGQLGALVAAARPPARPPSPARAL